MPELQRQQKNWQDQRADQQECTSCKNACKNGLEERLEEEGLTGGEELEAKSKIGELKSLRPIALAIGKGQRRASGGQRGSHPAVFVVL